MAADSKMNFRGEILDISIIFLIFYVSVILIRVGKYSLQKGLILKTRVQDAICFVYYFFVNKYFIISYIFSLF